MKFIRNKLGTGFELPEPIEPTSYYVHFGRGSGKSLLQDELYKKLTKEGVKVLRVNATTFLKLTLESTQPYQVSILGELIMKGDN